MSVLQKEGQWISYDLLANEIIRQEWGDRGISDVEPWRTVSEARGRGA